MVKIQTILAIAISAFTWAQQSQPGAKWTEDQLRQAVAPVRVGRKLTLQEFAFVRGDPKIKALHRKMGLPEFRN